MEKITALQVLEVNKNQLEDISYLATGFAGSLKYLNASCNGIKDLDATAHTVASLLSLDTLDCYGNPIEADFKYKFKLAENSKLLELDGITITAAMRQELDVRRT